MAKQTQDYSDRFKQFANKVKSEPIKTPIQKVVPIVPKEKKEAEKGFNVHIKDKSLKALKLKAIKEETSVKTLINQAIEQLLTTGITVVETDKTKGKKEPETPFYLLIHAENLKTLKVKALETETTIKELINLGIEKML